MKRQALIKRLKKHNCILKREGTKHSIYENINTGEATTVPRHKEINTYTGKSICRDLNIPVIDQK